jgi:hypothetical protein
MEQYVPSVNQQYNLLAKIWQRESEGGYVFLPWIPGTIGIDRKASFHNGPAFEWPPTPENNTKAQIIAHLKARQNDDIYFTPSLFIDPERKSALVAEERALWADLDEVSPESIPPKYEPTLIWETSPGRYQAVWLFMVMNVGASDHGRENHRLSTLLGADPSGWDSTQLLRVPGTRNHKAEHVNKKTGKGWQGKVFRDGEFGHEPNRPDWSDFLDLPEIPAHLVTELKIEDMVFEKMLDDVNRKEVIARVNRKLPSHVKSFIKAQSAGDNDRSAIAWQIARELADAGCTLVEIVAIIRETVWNKYHGRQDELKRLQTEAGKAISQRILVGKDTHEVAPKEWSEWQEFHDWGNAPTPRVSWLVKGYWIEGGLGFIGGVPKSYKSWFGLNLALAIASGCDFLGEAVTGGKRNVLYIQEEDSEGTVKDRLGNMIDDLCPDRHWQGKMEYDGESLWWSPGKEISLQLRISTGFIASDPDWLEKLELFVTTHQIDFVLIDTMMTVAGDTPIDKANEMRSDILNPLKEMAREHNVAICFVHHNTKGKEESGGRLGKPVLLEVTRASTRMMGSGQLHAWADCGIYVRDKKGMEVIIEVENKKGEDVVKRIRIDQTDEKRFTWKPRVLPNHQQEESEELKAAREVNRSWGKPGVVVQRLRDAGGVGKENAMTPVQLARVTHRNPLNTFNQLKHAVKQGHVIAIPPKEVKISTRGGRIEVDPKFYIDE